MPEETMYAPSPRWLLLLSFVFATGCDDDAEEAAPLPDAGLSDAGSSAPAHGDAGGVSCSEAAPCITPTGQQGLRACLNGLLYNECVASDAGPRDAQVPADSTVASACPTGLSCDDVLAALSSLGFADDGGTQLACGSLAKDPLFGFGDVFQPPSCRSKADCMALGLDVPCQTFRSFGDRCTRSCTR
jgi:hypothetical protein